MIDWKHGNYFGDDASIGRNDSQRYEENSAVLTREPHTCCGLVVLQTHICEPWDEQRVRT